MKLSSHPIRDNTIAAVLGGIVLAGLGKLFGIVPQAWNGIAAAAGWLWSLALRPVSLTIPLWGWLLGIAVLFVMRKVIRAWSVGLAHEPASNPALTTEQPLEELDLEIMKLFARTDGMALSMQEIAGQCFTNQLRASRALERLAARRLVDLQAGGTFGPTFRITRDGRDYLLDHGLA